MVNDSRNLKTKVLPWWHPVMGGREKELLAAVIDENYPNEGNYTTSFEDKVAEICDAPYAVAATSGTAAIFLGLAACGIGAGDEVIVPDITFIATANAVRLAGASPVLVDVQFEDFNIDPECIEQAITERTRAIVPVHVSGRAANMDSILSIARKYNLHVVEDAAEALGSRVNGQALGTFGDVGCFSFSANKTITTGQGGMLVTHDERIYRRLKELKDHGRPERGTGGADIHLSLGYNFKLTNLHAVVGLAQIESFWKRAEHQCQLYRWYRQYLPDSPRIRLIEFNVDQGEVPQWVDIWAEDRDSLHDHLLERNIHTRKFWYPIHTQAPYLQANDAFPESIRVSAGALWLSSALTLTEEDVKTVCQAIFDWLAL